jgi:hypothetical protein
VGGASLLIALRVYVFPPQATSSNQTLIGAASIAIWKRNKAVIAATIIIWGIDVGFLIQGKLFPLLQIISDYKTDVGR